MVSEEFERAKYLEEVNREHALRTHERNQQDVSAYLKASLDSANAAMRALLLVNGSAVVALLAFIGTLESGDSSNEIKVAILIYPIIAFALGTGFSVTTAFFAYLVNLFDHDIAMSVNLTWKHPYVEKTERADGLRPWRKWFHIAAIVSAIMSLIAFFTGIFAVAKAISSLAL